MRGNYRVGVMSATYERFLLGPVKLPHYRALRYEDVDALHASKCGGFGEKAGMKMGVSHPFTYRGGTSNTGLT